ncbi:hypothetical protein [Hahella sp. NBU794]
MNWRRSLLETLLQRRWFESLPVIRMGSVYEGVDQGAVNFLDAKM